MHDSCEVATSVEGALENPYSCPENCWVYVPNKKTVTVTVVRSKVLIRMCSINKSFVNFIFNGRAYMVPITYMRVMIKRTITGIAQFLLNG